MKKRREGRGEYCTLTLRDRAPGDPKLQQSFPGPVIQYKIQIMSAERSMKDAKQMRTKRWSREEKPKNAP